MSENNNRQSKKASGRPPRKEYYILPHLREAVKQLPMQLKIQGEAS